MTDCLDYAVSAKGVAWSLRSNLHRLVVIALVRIGLAGLDSKGPKRLSDREMVTMWSWPVPPVPAALAFVRQRKAGLRGAGRGHTFGNEEVVEPILVVDVRALGCLSH